MAMLNNHKVYIYIYRITLGVPKNKGSPNHIDVMDDHFFSDLKPMVTTGVQWFFESSIWVCLKMLSPLYPMVLLIKQSRYEKWLFHWGYILFSDKPIYHHTALWIDSIHDQQRMPWSAQGIWAMVIHLILGILKTYVCKSLWMNCL